MRTLMNDLKYGVRMLAKSPGFTAVAVLTLVLGIGACTATFSLVNAVLLRPLPFREPERLAWIENLPRPAPGTPTLSVDNFVDWRAQAASFEALAAYDAFFDLNRYTLSGDGEPQRLRGVQVSQNFLDVLGMRPMLGRNFVEEECVWNGRRAVILNHAFWELKFGGATDVIGRTVTINGESVEIVGILPASDNLDVLFSPGSSVEFLLPFPLTEQTAAFASRWGNTLFAIGRLKPGVTVAQAQDELAVISARLNESKPERVKQNGGRKFGARVARLEDHVRRPFRPAFILLSGAVLCVLLIACVNLSNLLLARANARRHEFSVRIALGASRWRLVRQMMTESLLLACVGCVPGALGAAFCTAPFASLRTFSIPLLHTASVDMRTLMVTIILTCLAAFLCGVLPAVQLWRCDPSEVLQEAGSRGGTGKGTAWIRRILVVTEIGLACMLLVGAGLLLRSLVSVLQVNLGFQPEHTFAWRVDPARAVRHLTSRTEEVLFYDRLMERLSVIPGVDSVGLTDSLPLGFKRSWSFEVKGVTNDPEGNSQASVAMIDQRYLQTMRIPLRGGRYFNDRDSADAQKVMIVSETMARNFWPGQDPVGQTAVVNGPEWTVVGVVADVRHGLEETPQPDMYFSFRQDNRWNSPQLVVRARRAPAALIADVRAAMKEFGPTLASNEFTAMDEIVDRAVAPRRLITGILSSFSSCALLLAVIGLYGVITYSVGQRTREIGVRVALGAQRGDVLWLVLGEGLRLAGVGVAAGFAAAFFVTGVLQSQLYGVSASDPFTYAITATVLVMVALLACYLPARRAAKVDPMAALRHE